MCCPPLWRQPVLKCAAKQMPTKAGDQTNGCELIDRMDGNDLESGHRMHQDQSRMQTLLREAYGDAIEGHGAASLPKRVRSDVARRSTSSSVAVEEAPLGVRQLDE